MLEMNSIKEGVLNFTFPVILVEASGKDQRPCIDYRKLKAITKTEFFRFLILARVEKVTAVKYITDLDLTKGFRQIPMTPRAQK